MKVQSQPHAQRQRTLLGSLQLRSHLHEGGDFFGLRVQLPSCISVKLPTEACREEPCPI